MHRIGAYSEGLEELGKTSQERKVRGGRTLYRPRGGDLSGFPGREAPEGL